MESTLRMVELEILSMQFGSGPQIIKQKYRQICSSEQSFIFPFWVGIFICDMPWGPWN
jgi:hypothetical protein